MREEKSQSPITGKKQRPGHAAYPDEFEGTWETYQPIAAPNSVKAEAYKLWRKLGEADRLACDVGLYTYVADLLTTREKRPDAPAKYLETFIAKRAWEPLVDETAQAHIRKMIKDRHAAK